MKGITTIKLKPMAGSLGRKALLLGAATALVAGMATLSATDAFASVGSGSGVSFSPASGPTTNTPTWSTTAGCPAGDNGSAVLAGVGPDGSTLTFLSSFTNSAAAALNPGPALLSNLAVAQSVIGTPNGGSMEAVLLCFPGPSGTGSLGTPTLSTFINFSADGSSYTTGSNAVATATTTTLSVQPSTVTVGNSVKLTATVTAASGTASPTGTVTFMNGTTAIGSPVALSGSGGTATATTSTTPTVAGSESLTAVYSNTDGAFSGSTSAAVTLTVNALSGQAIPLSVTVGASGAFTLTVDTTDTVTLAITGTASSGDSLATASTTPITVSDTRNTFPGWAVSGQSTDFTESATTPAGDISGNQLGWAPTDTALGTGVLLGPVVPPGNPGLGSTPAILAQAHAPNGTGTSTLGANLTLDIPQSSPAATYTAALSITAATANP